MARRCEGAVWLQGIRRAIAPSVEAIASSERPKRLADIARDWREVVQRLVVIALTARVDFPGELAEWPEIVLTTMLADAA